MYAAGATAIQVHFALVNDCHAVLEPWGPRDHITLEGSIGGYARAVYIVDSLRGEYPDIIFVHAGDILTGDFLSTMTIGYGVWDLWISAGVRAFALGNHEFEYGPGALDTVLGLIDVPLLCANLDATGYPNLAATLKPYIIIPYPGDTPEDTINIAFFGVCTEETDYAGWTSPLDLGDVVTAIDTFGLPPEADCAVALPHLDLTDDLLVAEIPFIDAVLGGHNHSVYEEPYWAVVGTDSTPVVKAGANVIGVGHLTMEYIEDAGLKFIDWEVIRVNSGVPEDSAARERLDFYRDIIASNPYIGLDPYNEIAFYAESTICSYPKAPAGSGWVDSPEGNLVTESYRTALGVDITVEGRGALRMPLFAGPVTYADLFRAVPAGRDPETGLNARLVTITMTGSELKQVLEYSILGATLSPELFPEFSGMRFAYNPYGSPLNKIDTDSWTIGDNHWNPLETYTLGATEILIYAMDLIGIPHGAVDTSTITVYRALANYCSDTAFIPVYVSDGRLIDLSSGIAEVTSMPTSITIETYPNPFNSAVVISVRGVGATFRSPGQVGLKIFDITGRPVADLPLPRAESGGNSGYREGCWPDFARGPTPLIWQPEESEPSGVYFVQIIGSNVPAKKIVYLR